jgi:hypothetical protein
MFYNLCIMLMCRCVCPCHVSEALLLDKLVIVIQIVPKLMLKTHSRWLPHQTSMSHIHEMIYNIHMMRMCRWVCPYHDSAALVGLAFGCYLELLLPHIGKSQHSAIVEAEDPFKMGPTSMANTYDEFHNIHMMWMSRCVCR